MTLCLRSSSSSLDSEPWNTEFWKIVPKCPATASWVKATVSSST